jgi:hypothetical protein
MNYIKRLQEEIKEKEQKGEEMNEKIEYFLRYLGTSKFQGPGNDYINTREVYNLLLALRMDLLDIREDEMTRLDRMFKNQEVTVN